MSEIKEYKHNGKSAFKGSSLCIKCGKNFKLDTTDKALFDNSKCFECFMEDNT